MFEGFVELGNTVHLSWVLKNTSDVPINADSAPTFRVYSGSTGALLSAFSPGTATQKHTGSVTGATNASPIEITSASHGLSTGMRVTITGVLGNTAANGTFNVTRTAANTFTLDGSTGNGAYTEGGTWNVSGLYDLEIAATGGNGFESGETFTVLVTAQISSSARADVLTFTVT